MHGCNRDGANCKGSHLRILTGLPCRDNLSAETEWCLTNRADDFALARVQTQGLGVIEARNTIARRMLECGTHPDQFCLWVDSDSFWEPGTITNLATTLEGLPMNSLVAAYFCARRDHCAPAALKFRNHLATPRPGIDPELCPVYVTGFHFVMHRLGLLRMLPVDPFSMPYEDGLGEDQAFSARVSAIGKCYTLTTAPVAHVDEATRLAYLPSSEPFKVTKPERLNRLNQQIDEEELLLADPDLRGDFRD